VTRSCCHRHSPVLVRKRGVRTAIKKPREVVDGCALAERPVQRAAAPQRPIGIRAVFQKPVHAFIVMPVELAGEHQADGVLGELATLDQDMDGTVIERLGGMVGDLTVIGVRAAFEQHLCQLGMMSDARSAVERALPFGLWRVVLFEEASVGVGARIEQSSGGLEEALAAFGLEPQKPREAEVRQGVPLARTALDGGICQILGEKARDRFVISEQRGGMDVAARDFGMRDKDFMRAIKRAMPYGCLDKFIPGILGGGLVFRHVGLIIARVRPAPHPCVQIAACRNRKRSSQYLT